jgi:hypothetical protein
MPLRKTDKGWYWGSKGPFDSKAKALSVSRSAYANGYKESEMNTAASFVLYLFHAVTNTHILHLQSKSFSEHMALGEYYLALIDSVDEYAECYQGKYGIIEGYQDNYELPPAPLEYLIQITEFIKTTRATLPQDSELQNLIDEIAALTDRTVYKLRFLK